MSDAPENADNPGVIAPPPLIYAGALAIGLLANRRYRLAFLPRGLSRVLGWPLIASGLAVGYLGFREMKRAGTNLDPREPTTTGTPLSLSFSTKAGGAGSPRSFICPVLGQ